MCDEREPLLTYLYDESDPAERRRVEAHLATCETCRDELAGLRRVREDLLAWDVPDHGSVWKPFTPARPSWSWRDVPAWTLAAAAAIVFAIGAGSSVAANAWLSGAAPRTAVALPAAPAVTTPASVRIAPAGTVSREDLAVFETRLLKELDDATIGAKVKPGITGADYDQLLAALREDHNALVRFTQRVNDLSSQVAAMQQAQQGGQGGR